MIVNFSSPLTAQRIEVMNLELRPTFQLQGACAIFGINMYCDVTVDLPSSFALIGGFPKMKVAGGAVELSGVDSQSEGPKVEILFGTDGVSNFMASFCTYFH